MESKTCTKCNVTKKLEYFYKHPMMRDGRTNSCKQCTKAAVTANRKKNIEYYRGYDAYRANLPHRKESQRKYSLTEGGRAAHSRAKAAWDAKNPIKKDAQNKVRNEIKRRRLKKPKKCSQCNKKAVGAGLHGHHDDYAKPLDIRWLCAKCHRQWHKHNEVLNG